MAQKGPNLYVGSVLEIDDTWVFNKNTDGSVKNSFRQNFTTNAGPHGSCLRPAGPQDIKLVDVFGAKARFIVTEITHEDAKMVGHGDISPKQDCLKLTLLNADGSYEPLADEYRANYGAQFPYVDGSLYKVNKVAKYHMTFVP